ncbi:flavodoxin [Allofustis seminis]|uniref:flavodoxin n=1 Tax=Allofustis seminis TaxID=166939 RepID=UPI0003828FBA|nr:flavodoxin [Allofustis seminis]
MPRVMIVYASLTGNTQAGAEILTDAFLELGAEVETVQSYVADPFEYQNADIVIAGSYTYGIGGELPDEILDFYEELEEVDLTGKIYGVFGSGDVFYEDLFCVAVDYFEQQFEKTGAIKGADGIKYNLYPDEKAENDLYAFAKELFDQYKDKH